MISVKQTGDVLIFSVDFRPDKVYMWLDGPIPGMYICVEPFGSKFIQLKDTQLVDALYNKLAEYMKGQ